MIRGVVLAGLIALLAPQFEKFTPVTQEMLLKPGPEDWLMFSRTYDAQRQFQN